MDQQCPWLFLSWQLRLLPLPSLCGPLSSLLSVSQCPEDSQLFSQQHLRLKEA